MNNRAASRAVSRITTPKNCAVYPAFYNWIYDECGADCGVFIIPRKRENRADRDKFRKDLTIRKHAQFFRGSRLREDPRRGKGVGHEPAGLVLR